MNAPRPSSPHPDEPGPNPGSKTLGDVLYGNKSIVSVSESDWARLVGLIAAGDQLALHTVYERTHRIVFTLAARITNNRETAEETTLDVFHEVWRRAAAYDPADGSVVGWIMNLARSRAIDRLRFEQRKKRTSNSPADLQENISGQDPQSACHLEEQGRLLRMALEKLTADERQVIEAAFFSELTYHEVAKTLNQPLGTVKTRIRSGLGKLRATLKGI